MKNLILNYGKNRIEAVGEIIDYIEITYVNGEAFKINHEEQTLTLIRKRTTKRTTIVINYVIDKNEIHLYNFHITKVNKKNRRSEK